jgi:biotin carboxyl carrier protein
MTNFAQNWLNIQCQTIPELFSALLLITDKDKKSLHPAAQWPEQSKEPLELVAIAKKAYTQQQTANNSLESDGSDSANQANYLALPIFANKQLIGVIAIKTKAQSQTVQAKNLDTLRLGTHWLAMPNLQQESDNKFYATVTKLTATCFEQEKYQQSLIALITELSTHFGCERIAIGEYKNQHTKVVALSNNAQFDSKSNLIRSIADAMDEAIDQDQIITIPNNDEQQSTVDIAHREHMRSFGSGSICTLPLIYDGQVFGALTMEYRDEAPISPESVRLCEQTMALATPFLKLKKKDERWLGGKIWDSITHVPSGVFNLNHLGLKFSSILLAVFLVYAGLVDGDFRIHADAILEGKIQRTIAAPIDGFIESADVRAGDTVEKNQIMATMDDADLELELIKLSSQQQRLQREYREAMAGRDLVKVRILNAQINQIKAQKKLVNEQLKRTRIKAPFKGIVIEGDLSQSLGSPVERGDSLFKIAPLEGYRIILKVDEKEISYVHTGQQGYLVLSSLPNNKFALTVEKITAIANTEDGSNIFRVEATLPKAPELLRPGMEGIGKIEVGQKKLLWIWTHDLIAWIKLWLWSWLP